MREPTRRVPSLGAAAAELAAYVGVVVWLTWPLATHAKTHLPGICSWDALHGIWALTWAARMLVEQPTGLVHAAILHPTPRALFYAPNGLGPSPLFAPPFLLTGNPVLAFDLTLIACLALTAWGLHRVVGRWTGSRLAGAVAGTAMLTSPQWTLYLTQWPTYLAVHWVPWIVALVARETLSVRATMLLSGLIALQCLADPVYIAPAVAAPVAAVALARLVARDTRRAGLRLLTALAAAGLALSPLYAGYLAARPVTHAGLRRPSEALWRTLADPLSLPWAEGFAPVTYTTLVLVAVGLACAAVARNPPSPGVRRGWAHGAVWAGVGLLVCAPVIVIFGSPPLHNPLPRLIEALAPGVLDVVRGMQRLSFGMTTGLALLAGMGFAGLGCLPGLRGRGLQLVLAATAIAGMYLEWRQAMTDAALLGPTPSGGFAYRLREPESGDTPLVRALAQGHGPVLELPAVHPLAAHASYRAIFHRRPLLNGYASHFPPGYGARMQLATRLPDPAALQRLRAETGLASIVVHTASLAFVAPQWLALAEGAGTGDLRLVARDRGALLFDVVPPPAR